MFVRDFQYFVRPLACCGLSPVPFLGLNSLQPVEIVGESVIAIQARVRSVRPVRG